jgi:hypothetical protein
MANRLIIANGTTRPDQILFSTSIEGLYTGQS